MFKCLTVIGLVSNTFLQTVNAATIEPPLPSTQLYQIALATDNSLWVVTLGKVLHLTATGQLLNAYPIPGASLPIIATAADTSVWILFNDGSNNVMHYNAEGNLLNTFKLAPLY